MRGFDLSIPQHTEILDTVGGSKVTIGETENLVFTRLFVIGDHATVRAMLTDEELKEIRDMCTRLLRTRRRRK